MSGKAVRETLGFLAVVAGLVFVGLELRQNTSAVAATALNDMTSGQVEWFYQVTSDHPVTPRVVEGLLEAQTQNAASGDEPVLPAPKNACQPMSRHLARNWWKKAEKLAGLEPKPGRGWHSFRRKFASDFKDLPLKTLCELGGWKTHQTVLTCYQHAGQEEMREALESRHTGSRTDTRNGHASPVPRNGRPHSRP